MEAASFLLSSYSENAQQAARRQIQEILLLLHFYCAQG